MISAKDFMSEHDINYKTWRRYLKEMREKYLIDGEPVLFELTEGDELFLSINKSMFKYHYPAHLETAFYFEAYQKIGHFLDHKNLRDDLDTLKSEVFRLNGRGEQLARKFHYLSKTDGQTTKNDNQSILVQALIENKKLNVNYNDKEYDLYPICLTMYRGALYLIAYKDTMLAENLRHFKLIRFNYIEIKDEIFPYPATKEWNPEQYFENHSGIMSGELKECTVRVYAPSMQIVLEKNFFESKVLNSSKSFAELELTYSNIEEFLGQLFIYAQDVEVLKGDEVKKAFNKKALLALKRNKAV